MFAKTVALFLALGSASFVFADPFAITGVQVENGPVPIRRNIDDLASEAGPQWDLYVQAYSAMDQSPSSDPLSYFQIGGIHGWPFVQWNNTGEGNGNDIWAGYCPHGEPLFLSWHRAYVALYEQVLVDNAKRIASQYPEDRRPEYLEAANSLRAPFWDWASSREVPEATVVAKVKINTAEGQKEVENPLSTYRFPQEAVQGQFGNLRGVQHNPRRTRQQIQRCPSPQSYPRSANDALSLRNNGRRMWDLGDMVYDVFTTSETFDEFASTRNRGTSLEQIHNIIHVEAACGSDFQNQGLSGFDPLFMLHHANVDRLWAYWQAIHPQEGSFTGSYAGGARFTTEEGETISPDSPLLPFFGQGGKPLTPKIMASIRDFGYSYEGLEFGEKTEEEMGRDATRLINRLYSDSDDFDSGPPGKEPPAGTNPPPVSKPPTSSFPTPSNTPPNNDNPPNNDTSSNGDPPSSENPSTDNPSSNGKPPVFNNPAGNFTRPGISPPLTNPSDKPTNSSRADKTKRHYAQIQLKVDEVERPCFVSVFIADIYAGSMVVMSQPATGIVHGAVLLNDAMENYGNMNGGSSAFDGNVHVEITKSDGDLIELSSVPSLNVEVDLIDITPPSSNAELPTPRNKQVSPVSSLTPPPPGSAGSAAGPPLEGGRGGRRGGRRGGGRGGQSGRQSGGERGESGRESGGDSGDESGDESGWECEGECECGEEYGGEYGESGEEYGESGGEYGGECGEECGGECGGDCGGEYGGGSEEECGGEYGGEYGGGEGGGGGRSGVRSGAGVGGDYRGEDGVGSGGLGSGVGNEVASGVGNGSANGVGSGGNQTAPTKGLISAAARFGTFQVPVSACLLFAVLYQL